SGSGIVVTTGATVVIYGVGIGVDCYCSTRMMVVTDRGGGKVVIGVSVGISGIGERTVGSGITKTGIVSIDGD
nr:hypothetical protein [Tanacetum cinerariifolium]